MRFQNETRARLLVMRKVAGFPNGARLFIDDAI